MKKMILALAVLVSTLSAFAGEEKITPKVLNAFKSEFNTAKEVEWTVGHNYYKAAFVYNDKHVLPLSLQSDLKKNYCKYWITDLFEVANTEGTTYYITLENADTKIVLKASAESEWSVHEKTRKA